ncbi:Phage tail fiber protein [Pseudomonas synxantha]|uniref:Phage tail fiber protein n=1 Tax=Pseudomonas synxantha TaxID=47883 RepID=A0A3G7U3U2_9PSED|nr:phage tail protein [Pseudomonas synxantha]AZE54043.1 Phage tail fiber protein [Pseudomonas synxantha]
MIDQNSQFMAILTNVGTAKLANANTLGLPWKLTALGVGDANGTDPLPSATQTTLINERRRAPLNQLLIDPINPAVIIAEQVIPADVGGWWIREMGLYDEDGDLVAVSNCAPSFKPVLSQGSGRTQIVRMNFIVSSTGNIVLKIDPAVVLATREYVDAGFLPLKGGTLTGSLNLIESRSVYIQPDNAPTWAAGLIAGTFGGEKAGVGFLGSYNTLNVAFLGLGATPWASGNGVRVTVNGVEIAGPITGNGTGLTGLKFSALTGLPNSLAGYGIQIASQTEAETGADTNKPMSALRVFQAIVAKVVQATESALGTARIATQTLVNAGTDDSSIVTPKKLRWGFQILIGQTGYIVFPTYLGGWIVQWSLAVSLTGSAVNQTNFHIPFPNDIGTVVVGAFNNTGGGEYSVRLSDGAGGVNGAVTKYWFKTYNTGVTGQAGLSYIAVGT